MTPAQFRADFPEFADLTAYPDSSVNFWLNLAGILILACVWGDVQPYATELFVAHNLALERWALVGAAGGGVPGMTPGLSSGKTVDKLSITYDTSAGIVKDAGHWNLTTFGLRFIQMARMPLTAGYQAGAGMAYAAPGAVLTIGGPYGAGWPYYGP